MEESILLLSPTWIDTPEKLNILVKDLSQEPMIAVDTESNSLYAYQEQVCLLQFSTPHNDYLVDPLALESLAPLEKIFSAPHIEKVFHAAEYDLICLQRDFGFSFENLFDTMWAARILGYKHIGLGALLGQYFGIHPDKRYQRANWGKRPLPAEQLQYAQLDTHYLIPLRNILYQELKSSPFWELSREDFKRFCRLNGTIAQNTPPCWQQIHHAYDLSPRQLAVLQKLCEYRDQLAQQKNLPLFKVLSNKTLLQIAENMPSDFNGLQAAGVSQGQIRRCGQGLLRAIQSGQRAPALYSPVTSPPDAAYLERLDALQHWRKITARGLNTESDIVLPRTTMEKIAAQNPTTPDALRKVMAAVPWRYEKFGEDILHLLRGWQPASNGK